MTNNANRPCTGNAGAATQELGQVKERPQCTTNAFVCQQLSTWQHQADRAGHAHLAQFITTRLQEVRR